MYEASGVNPEFIYHHLNINPKVIPKKQLPWHSSREHVDAIKDEVRKLKQARPIKEVFYLQWLANTIVVKKKLGIWKVCVDFTNLNKASPKDPFPVPRCNFGHPRMSFLDAFQGYHQISLALPDQEKTAFLTLTRNYHYRVMPFGLKNAGFTYQRMMTRMFESQLGKNVEAYIDDMEIKSKKEFEHLIDLGEIFTIL